MSASPVAERQGTSNSTLPKVLESLKDLIAAEETNEGRVKLKGKVAWFGDVVRFRGSTIPHASKAVIVFTSWATVVAVADFVYGKAFNLSNSVVPLLSVVVGLMLVFRNTTAFARWDDGRKSFTALQGTVRNTARDCWISIGAPALGQTSNKQSLSYQELRTKARFLRMLVAFVVAVKRHVRGQYGADYEDLKALLPPEFYDKRNQPGFGFDAADADVGASLPTSQNTIGELPNSNDTTTQPTTESAATKPSPRLTTYQRLASVFFSQEEEIHEALSSSVGVSETSPLLRRSTSPQRVEDSSVVVVHNYLSRPSLPLPLVIAHQLHLYLARCKRMGYLETIGPAGYGRLTQAVSKLTDLFGQIDGLSMSPIPACYGIHLKQCTSLYLFALPLTLASDLGWTLIPFVTIVAFTLVGIEALARECEDPFGTDASDLPLDYICADLRNEIEHLIAKLGCDPDQDLMI